MNNKVTIGAASAVAAAALAVGVAVSIPDTTEIKGTYEIREVNPYCSEVRVSVPDEFTPDIVELKMNDLEVAKTLLPHGYISTYPTVVSDKDRLSMNMYVRGEEAATAVFNDGGTLAITVKDKYLHREESVTEEPESVTETPESAAGAENDAE